MAFKHIKDCIADWKRHRQEEEQLFQLEDELEDQVKQVDREANRFSFVPQPDIRCEDCGRFIDECICI
jgi:hypothetical protein